VTRARRLVPRGLRWRLDLREGIDFAMYLGMYEPVASRAIQAEVQPGWTVLDIGANNGAHALPMARQVGPHGKVYAFEPTDYSFAKLRDNVALNPELAARIVCRQTMLSAESSRNTAPAIASSWPLNGAGDAGTPHGGRPMPSTGADVAALDDCVEALGIRHIDFIKLDVCGNEPAVLQGAVATLSRMRPVVISQFAPYLHGKRFTSMVTLVRELGYRAETARDGQSVPLVADSITALCDPGRGIDLMLRPYV